MAGGLGWFGQTCVLDRLDAATRFQFQGTPGVKGWGASGALSGLGVVGLDTQGFTLGYYPAPLRGLGWIEGVGFGHRTLRGAALSLELGSCEGRLTYSRRR